MMEQKLTRTKKKHKELEKISGTSKDKKIKVSDFLPKQLKEIFDNSGRKIGEQERILLSLLVEIIVEITIREEL